MRKPAPLPRFGVRWSATGHDQVTASHQMPATPVEVNYRLDPAVGPRRYHWFTEIWLDQLTAGTIYRDRPGGQPRESSLEG